MATEGEGIHIGTPQIFVRFQGCAIGCLNCDTKESWEFTNPHSSVDSVIATIEEQAGQYPHRIKRVSITGGDPLHPKNAPAALALTRSLKKLGYYVNIEAAGSRVVDEIFDSIDFVSFDFKTPSTGVTHNKNLLLKMCQQYAGKTQIKAVIADKKDFEATYDIYTWVLNELDNKMEIPWVLTPCYEPDEEFPQERFAEIINMNTEFGAPFRVIGQQHKWFFGPSKKDV